MSEEISVFAWLEDRVGVFHEFHNQWLRDKIAAKLKGKRGKRRDEGFPDRLTAEEWDERFERWKRSDLKRKDAPDEGIQEKG